MATTDPAARTNIEAAYPLSPLQQGLLFHSLKVPDAGLYVVQWSCSLGADLVIPVFRRAWEKVVERHPVLRTAFMWKNSDQPLQVVGRQVKLPWREWDLRALPPDECRQRIATALEEERRSGFNPSVAPLLRFLLVRTEEDYEFVASFHHLLLDGWSLGLVFDEVLRLYSAWSRGAELALPESRPYQDYIQWLGRQDQGAAERFWRQALAGFEKPTPVLPEAGAGSPNGPGEQGEVEIALGGAEMEALQTLSRHSRLTVNTLVLGAWALLLARTGGEEVVLFGSVVSGRPEDLPGVGSMVGLFINTLPVLTRVVGDRSLLPWLHDLQRFQVEARRYEYASLLDIQGWSAVPRHLPLFESLVMFGNYPVSEEALRDGQRLGIRRGFSYARTNYPLNLAVEGSRELSLRLLFDASRFSRPAARRWLEHLTALLREMTADPGRCLDELPLLSPAEHHQTLCEWSDTAASFPRQASIPEVFAARAAEHPEREALTFSDARLTYGELALRAGRLAAALRLEGVRPGDLVGLCAERSAAAVAGMLGILHTGAAYVPLDPAYPQERLVFMVEDSGLRVVLAQERLRGRLEPLDVRVVALEDEGELAPAGPPSRIPAEALAYVIYTSGSTGRPKGVAVPHRAVLRLVLNADYVRLAPGDVMAQVSNLSFDAATFEVWGALLNGARLAGIPAGAALSPVAMERHLREQGITTLFLTTALFHQIVRDLPGAFRRLRHLLFGGEKADAGLVRGLLRQPPHEGGPPGRLLHVYGPTESTTYATWHLVREVGEGETSVPIGGPLSNTRAYLVGRSFQPAPVGAPAELMIGGEGLAWGYLGRPELTAERFVPDPWSGEPGSRLYRSGDLARWLPGGAIDFLGRIDQQVKVRGFRVEPGEIEAALRRHPGVADAVVQPWRHLEVQLAAYAVPVPGSGLETAELRIFLRDRLPEYMVPATLLLLDALPLTPNGKVDRAALPKPGQEAPGGAAGPIRVPPRDDLESRLVEVWEEVLGRQVGVTDGFFDLGGHSLLAIRLVAQIRKRFGRELSIAVLFDTGTVERMAAALREEPADAPPSPLVPLQPRGDKAPLFCVHPGGGGVACFTALARHFDPGRPLIAIQDPFLREGRAEPAVEEMAARYVEEIRAHQKDGPYFLSGYSFGGTIAFEIARQLRGAGCRVGAVMILDTASPGTLRAAFGEADDALLLAILLGEMTGQPIHPFADELRQEAGEEERLRRAARHIPGKGKDWLAEQLRVFRGRIGTLARYAPAPLPVPVTLILIRASETADLEGFAGDVLAADPALGWGRLSMAPVEVVTVPGDHSTLLAEPQAKVLAAELCSRLDAAQEAAGSPGGSAGSVCDGSGGRLSA